MRKRSMGRVLSHGCMVSGAGYTRIRYSEVADLITRDRMMGKLMDAGLVMWSEERQGYRLLDDPKWQQVADAGTQDYRKTPEYERFRFDVLSRDKFTCQRCGAAYCELHAHHVRPFAEYPGGRFDPANGITLCVPYHEKEHGRRLR